MTHDLSELMEEPAQEQRQLRSQSVASLAGQVDKAALLEAFGSEIEAVEAEAQRQSGALSTAHDEDVVGWAAAIAQWLQEHSTIREVSLIQLQHGLKMPIIEI